jgi:hypothetical protein
MTYFCSLPYYANPDKTIINVIWEHPTLGKIPFSASLNDPMTYGPAIFQEALDGIYGPVVSFEDSHWFSTTDNNQWNGHTYRIGDIMISPTGEQPPNSTQTPPPQP